jgi:hypothetical protein
VIFDQILDDAALFPPGNASAEAAVPAHEQHINAAYARCVGPFVVPAARLSEIAALWESGSHQRPLEVALTFSDGPRALVETLALAARSGHIRVVAVEVALPPPITVTDAVHAVRAVVPDAIRAYVEVPRDQRRTELLAALSGSGLRAKFRTGGITADAYPDELELAEAIHRSVAHGVAFKATAGLHHAVRNTDTATGFEQHGFLNIIAAVAAAREGASAGDLAALLGSRDGSSLAETIAALSDDQIEDVRRQFTSFGTCSVVEPLEDLVRLNLLPADTLSAQPQGVHR